MITIKHLKKLLNIKLRLTNMSLICNVSTILAVLGAICAVKAWG